MSREICFREWLDVNEAWYHPVVAGLAMGSEPADVQKMNVAPKVEKMSAEDHIYKDLKDKLNHLVSGVDQSEFNNFANTLLSQVRDDYFWSTDPDNQRSIIHSRNDLEERLVDLDKDLRNLFNNISRIEQDARNPQDQAGFSGDEKQFIKEFRARNVSAFASNLDMLRSSIHDFMEKSANYDPQNDSEKESYKDLVKDMITIIDHLYMKDGFVHRLDLALKDLERKTGAKPNNDLYGR